MQVFNSRLRYGAVAVGLHWLVALLIAGMIGLGFAMVRYFEAPAELATKFTLYQWHKSFGITILALALLRLGWRQLNPVPPLPGTLRPWERVLARGTHAALYGLLLATPLAGWVMASASSLPTGEVFGLFTLPALVGSDEAMYGIAREVHEILAWSLVAVVALHVAGALKHHFVLKDDVLLRMLPVRSRRPRAAAEAGE
jgi:cytochrome b561